MNTAQDAPSKIDYWFLLLLLGVSLASHQASAGLIEPVVERAVPQTAGGMAHGFTEGQMVTVRVPSEAGPDALRWRALDDRAGQVAHGAMNGASTSIAVGKLGIGWYRIEFLGDDEQCLAWRKQEHYKLCLVCDEQCPYKAVTNRIYEGEKRPFVDEAKCVGCGMCEQACPIKPETAIIVYRAEKGRR